MTEVIIDGKRYVPADEPPPLLTEPDLPGYTSWIPKIGDMVWMNLDSGPPLGVVVGYLNRPGQPRHGQPVVECQEDQRWPGKKAGERSIVHPIFIWPFEPGSPEHHQAIAEGRIK